jgi:hypothetical protein
MKKLLLSLGLIAVLATDVLAATDGTVGATSTGTSTISVTIPKLIRIRSMADFTTASYSGTGDIDQNDDVNVSSNYTGTYQVTGTGSGAANAFTITDGSQTIAYSPYFNDATGTSGRALLSTGVALTSQSGAATTLGGSTLNANVSLNMTEANIQAVNAGTYTGVLTLVFAPE